MEEKAKRYSAMLYLPAQHMMCGENMPMQLILIMLDPAFMHQVRMLAAGSRQQEAGLRGLVQDLIVPLSKLKTWCCGGKLGCSSSNTAPRLAR